MSAKELWSELRTRWSAVFQRDRRDAELREELQAHLEMEVEDLIRRGVEPAEARRRAAMEFGAMPKAVEESRESWGMAWFDDSLRDARLGARSLVRAPRFSVAALLSLSLGIAATVLVWSLVEAVILRELPYGEPERVVRLWELTPDGDRFSTSDLNVLDFRRRVTLLDGIAVVAFPDPTLLLERDGERLRVQGVQVSGNFFDVLGVEPAAGRFWSAEETAPGTTPRSVVVSRGLWRSLFGEAELAGQSIRLGGETWSVLGVAPSSFRFGVETDLWLPYPLDPERPRGDHRLAGIARLAEGATFDDAEDQLAAVAAELAREHPDDQEGYGAELQPIREWFVGEEAERASAALAAAVALLLLLACASVSGLLMARAGSRDDEMALRRALGAGRGRLVRQLLAEALLLGGAGAALGVGAAAVLLPLLRATVADTLPRADEMALSWTTAGVGVVAALVTSLLFGVLPAWRGSTARAAGSRGASPQRLRSALVVGQLALALVLVVSSLTLLTSVHRLGSVDPGFDVDRLLAVGVTLPADRYPETSDEVRTFYRRALEEVRAIPGVRRAGASTLRPFVGPDLRNTVGREDWTAQSDFLPVRWRAQLPGTFATLGQPLLRGRDFEPGEENLVAILSASLASRLFGDEDPIGRGVRWIAPRGPVATVVGVVADSRDLEPGQEPWPTYYWHQGQIAWPDLTLLVRSETPPESLRGAVADVLRGIDPTLPPPEVTTVTSDFQAMSATPRLSASVFGAFALLATVIAVVGLYGLIAYAATTRRSEIAVRLALGARPSGIGALFVRRGLALVAAGLVLGLLGVMAVASLLAGMLHETRGVEPLPVLLAVALFAVAGAAASLLPALRVARRPPTEGLHEQ